MGVYSIMECEDGEGIMGKKNQLDLLLINPGTHRGIYQSLGPRLSAVEPPIWAGLMATFIRNQGFSVAILDVDADGLSAEETAKAIRVITPRITAIVVYGHNPSASTQVMPSAGMICTVLKNRVPDLKVLLVGGHVSALPERTLREEDVDFVCGGEGPYTLLDLLQALKTDHPDYSKVRDLWYWDGEIVRSTSPAPLVRELDHEMSGISWDLLPMDKYRAHNWHCFGDLKRQPYAALYTTLGCPYHCSFCCIQSPFRRGEKALGYKENINSYRRWSPQKVISQIEYLVDHYGVRNIKFADEIFVLNPTHVNEICDLIIERRYDLNIWAYARVDSVQERMLDKLKRAGFNWLAFGIETADERVRNDVHKGYKADDLYKTLEKVRAAGIHVIGNYLFGLPEDNLETMQATLDLALELRGEFVNFNCTMAYPGSQLYEVAVKEGWPLPMSWSGYSQYSEDSLPLPTRYISGGEVLRFRDLAFQVYFNNPTYLEMINRKFGEATLQHIQEMKSHPLVRKKL
jgi:radical SAM superfamily enzyme YgiQ (UPF0313 family)